MTKTGETTQVRASATPESDSVRRDAIARNLCARICDERRSIDELRVVDSVLSGLERGADVYGPLDLATDPRDWQMEIAEERRDELVYRSCALLSKRDERVTAPDAASVEEARRDHSARSTAGGTEGANSNPHHSGTRPASDARRLALSAPADTVAPHDGERTHGGNCQGGGKVHAPGLPSESCAGSSPTPDTSPVRGLGRETADGPAPAKRSDSTSRASLNPPRAGTLSAAGRHGAVGEPQTSLDPGHETPTGGNFSDCECSDEPWLRHRVDDRAESHVPWCPARVEAGLRELAAATPEVPDLNSAELWSAEMPGEVDGKFDDGGES